MIDEFGSQRPLEPKQSEETEGKAVKAYAQPKPPVFDMNIDLEEEPLALPAHTKPHHRFLAWWRSRTKKQKIILGSSLAVILLLIGGGATVALKPKPQQVVATTTVVKKASAGAPVAKTVPSTLTGLPVDPSVNQRPVTGVMIENSVDARPQSGLDQAGVVFEALAEGGVTRFLALFQDTQPGYIGPVRSARPYYIQWCQSFDCAYAHVGGSPDALQDIKDWNIKDLNQFYGASFFQRIGSRAAPHNVYTSISKLNAFESQKGYAASSYTGFARLDKAPQVDPSTITAKSINFKYSGPAYNVHYDYDSASNTYKRSEGGAAHTVVASNGNATQIAPKVVIAIAVPRGQGALDASGAYYSNYQVLGSGDAFVFQNGTVTHGTWTKASPNSQLDFLDDQGTTIKLDPGQTWISALDTIGNATYN